MAYYNSDYLRRLQSEAQSRFDILIKTLQPDGNRYTPTTVRNISISGIDVRLAVEDFKAILTEIRKLK